MTETTAEATTAAGRSTFSANASAPHPLLDLIITLLAPMFLLETGGDLRLARMAALETVNAYPVSNPADLIAAAQVIACDLAALSSLSLSMTGDIPLARLLRLRGNAVALNRCAGQGRRALRQSRFQPAAPFQAENTAAAEADAQEAGAAALQEPVSQPPQAETPPSIAALAAAAPAAKRQWQAAWGSAAATVAAEYTASLPHLPPVERKMATVRAAALNSAANDLLAGGIPGPLRSGHPERLRQQPL